MPRARSAFLYIFPHLTHFHHYIPVTLVVFFTFFFNYLFHTYYSRNPLINAQTFYHHITNQSPFFVELLFVRKLLLVDLKLRCIRPDFDDFRSENVKSANHRPVFPSKLEYRPLIGWKTGVRIALTLLLLTFTIKNIYITKRQKTPLSSCQTDSCSINLSRFPNNELCFRFADIKTLTTAQTHHSAQLLNGFV
jgi:hypothetical protein